ncbi:RAP domain protein [Candidatus Magnetobacterium bavaricum]|uniref:RAP domain protein n=1 Tax=Candidatus Magnetobacterium bavaricum TaxID=29290 RepID=A0A0F3GKG5_9BACT|nr:RAP domain protein [Candidatus Magnetobacterium bavaricum]
MITEYLSYLRDISRRIIISRYGFERALIDKSKNNPSFTFQITEEEFQDTSYLELNKDYIQRVYNHIEKSHDKSLFCGYGLICGTKNTKTFVAPIIFVECSLEKDDKGIYTIELDNSSLTLNHDLISKLLKTRDITEDDDDTFNFDEEIRVIEDAERELKDNTYAENLLARACRIFRIFKEKIEGFKQIEEFIGAYDFKTELKHFQQRDKRNKTNKSSFFEKDLIYIPDATHIFVSQVPDQLSTFNAIDMLINEVKENYFGNKTIENLLINALTDERRELKIDEYISNEVEKMLSKYLPIPLSSAQIAGIKSAWTSDISYIQGPPGTGKSYTISAIVLSALYLGKKVLVISQKTPALKVVKEMVEKYLQFSDGQNVQGIIYYEKERKSQVREHIKELLRRSDSTTSLRQEIQQLDKKIKEKENAILKMTNTIENIYSDLKNNLTLEHNYKTLNDKFLLLKDNFRKDFENVITDDYKFRVINKINAYETVLNKIKLIQSFGIRNLATELYISKFKRHIVDVDRLITDFRYLNDYQLYQFCNELIVLYDQYAGSLRVRNRLKYDNNLTRKKIQAEKRNLEQCQKELLRLKYTCNILNLLSCNEKYRIEIDKFSKMLWNTKTSLIAGKMKDIDFPTVLQVMPYWVAEIRHLGHVFPIKPDLFDLVVVDEASQVNIAEAIPAFYRGKKICIVGDHKQLGLDSTGVNFQLSKNLDVITWNKHFQSKPDYETAGNHKLTVTKASILDFIMSEANNIQRVQTSLDEHFRSMPLLAQYTNKHFYDDTLKVMTETPDKMSLTCFKSIKVDGKRDADKTIVAEAEKVIDIIKALTQDNFREILARNHKISLPDELPPNFSVGVISMIRNQCSMIGEMLDESIREDTIQKYEIKVDTPEEFQGHERDIIILSLCLDSTCKRGTGHFQNPRRLNVATSRARIFTILVYSDIPASFDKICEYERFLNSAEIRMPNFDPAKYESEFEREVYSYLEKYIEERQQTSVVQIFNQVVSCGQKRLDFVLYNQDTKKAVAVEVDGSHHFRRDGGIRAYTDEHIERMDILKRAGWNIINTPYYLWYNGGWLSTPSNERFQKEIERIYNELDGYLGYPFKKAW